MCGRGWHFDERMQTTTATPDDHCRVVLFARIPERLTDEQRRRKYDEPLSAEWGDAAVRGFSQHGDGGDDVEWVGIEVMLEPTQEVAFIVARLAELGAPPDTRIDIELAQASVQFSLAEARGENGNPVPFAGGAR